MADLREILDVQSLKAPTRPLIELLQESIVEAQSRIAAASAPGVPARAQPERDTS